MKKLLLSFCLLYTVLSLSAQNVKSIKIDATTVVKTVDGTILPYAAWQKLVQTGDFDIKL